MKARITGVGAPKVRMHRGFEKEPLDLSTTIRVLLGVEDEQHSQYNNANWPQDRHD